MADEQNSNESHNQNQHSRYGLRLRVYRPADGIDEGDFSSTHTYLTVVGFVEKYPRARQPTFDLLPPEYQCDPATSDAPPVWLARHNFGEGSYYLIPGNEDTGEPRLRALAMGGNYAGGVDPDFTILVGTTYPIPIHDRVLNDQD